MSFVWFSFIWEIPLDDAKDTVTLDDAKDTVIHHVSLSSQENVASDSGLIMYGTTCSQLM